MLSGGMGLLGTLGGAAILSDRRLKRNIHYVGKSNGHNIYEFEYIQDNKRQKHIGVMADEVIKIKPEAVVTMPDGYMAVNYAMIGVPHAVY